MVRVLKDYGRSISPPSSIENMTPQFFQRDASFRQNLSPGASEELGDAFKEYLN